MMRLRWACQVLILGVLSLCCRALKAQEPPPEELILLAVSWVLEESEATGLASRLLVDTVNATQGIGLYSAPHSGMARNTMLHVASSLEARTGKLNDFLSCPPEPPSPHDLSAGIFRGCRLSGGLTSVVQADRPRVSDQGAVVRVVLWVRHDLGPDNYGTDHVLREVILGPRVDGRWAVTGIGLSSISRW